MNTLTAETVDADTALKDRHRAMWALGDYAAVAARVIPSFGPILVEACRIGPHHRVLDVAAGPGNAAIPAAARGASVVASDLSPDLLAAGQTIGAAQGAQLEWEVADVEDLPFEDDAFDVVMSCVGVMFAPHHQRAADELLRVTQCGGTIGLLNWTPAGFIGQMLATMKPYAPPPPPGVSPPPLWGDPDYVRSLFGDRVDNVESSIVNLKVDQFATPEEFRDFFKCHYGPTIAVYANVAEDSEKTAALDQDLVDLARRFDPGGGPFAMDWEYLLLTAVRR